MKNKVSRFFVVFVLLLSVSACKAGILSGLQGFWKSISNSVSSSISNVYSSNKKAVKVGGVALGVVVSAVIVFCACRAWNSWSAKKRKEEAEKKILENEEKISQELRELIGDVEPVGLEKKKDVNGDFDENKGFKKKFAENYFKENTCMLGVFDQNFVKEGGFKEGFDPKKSLCELHSQFVGWGMKDKFLEKIMAMMEEGTEKSTIIEMLVRIYSAWVQFKYFPKEKLVGTNMPIIYLLNVFERLFNKKLELDKNEKDVLLLLFDDLAVENSVFFSKVQEKFPSHGIGLLFAREKKGEGWAIAVGSRLKALNKSKKIPNIYEDAKNHDELNKKSKIKMCEYLDQD